MAVAGSNLEKMIDLFLKLDTNRDEVVDLQELYSACDAEKITRKDVDEWTSKFDVDQNGKITLEEFCRGLGLRSAEMRIEKTERQDTRAGRAPALSSDVEVISSTMSQAKQVEITEKFKELLSKSSGKPEEMNNVVKSFKDYLDARHSRVWQAIVLTGSYWMKFSHEPFMSLQFKHGPHIVLVWRTPSS